MSKTFEAGTKVLNTLAPHILQVYEMGNAAMQANPSSFVAVDKLTTKLSQVLKRIILFLLSITFINLVMVTFWLLYHLVFIGHVFYNKDAFKNAGLDPEKPPVTSEEFEQIAAILKRKEQHVLASGWLSRVLFPSYPRCLA